MNEVLPKFYEACHSKFKDAREFMKLFHWEGRRQYESHQHVSNISATVNAILSNKNSGAAAKFFDEQYVHIPSDQLIPRGNIQKLVKVQEEVEKEEQDIKDHLNSLYSKSNKLKDGKGSQRVFDQERITVLTMLRRKIIQNIQHLQDAENKCKDMFHGHILKFKSKKHSKKENKKKAQKRKARREEVNFGLISKLLSDGEIPVKEVNVAALISLKGTQVYWLKQMMERGLISDQACTLIQEYLPSISSSNSESENSDTE